MRIANSNASLCTRTYREFTLVAYLVILKQTENNGHYISVLALGFSCNLAFCDLAASYDDVSTFRHTLLYPALYTETWNSFNIRRGWTPKADIHMTL
jgi:hypothetical protein